MGGKEGTNQLKESIGENKSNDTLWNSVLARLTGSAGVQRFRYTRIICNCREKALAQNYNRLRSKRGCSFTRFELRLIPSTNHRSGRARDARWDGDGSRISLCTARDLETTARQAGRGEAVTREHSLHDSFPKKRPLNVSQLTNSQLRDSSSSEIE